MSDNAVASSRVYTNLQGLTKLQYEYKKNPDAVKKEVAQQFESLLMQMVMHSMRDANKALGSDLFGSDQMDFYQDMFDKQMSMMVSNSHLGIAKMVEDNMDQMASSASTGNHNDNYVTHGSVTSPGQSIASAPTVVSIPSSSVNGQAASVPQTQQQEAFSSSQDFVNKLWPMAKVAASAIGTSPEVLLAQTALETNWGKNIIAHGQTGSSYNLFNIKADNSWGDKTVTASSLEQKDGVLVKEQSNFRSYDSFSSSFIDYVTFLKQNGRYSDALNKAQDPKQFVQALQDAGFATDQNYADKVMKIVGSQSFQGMVTKVKQGV